MTKKPGRPRNPHIDQALAIQTLRTLGKQGYAALSISDVAAVCGISKASLYRRYKDKKALVIAALSSIIRQAPQPLDTGSLERDLWLFVRDTRSMFEKLHIFPLLAALIVQSEHDTRPLNLVRQYIIAPRRRVIYALLKREQQRGNISKKIHLDIAVDNIVGVFFWRQIIGSPINDQWLHNAIKHHIASWQ